MLRAYQKRVLRQLAETDGRVLLQMPTGSGKTITAVEYARQRAPAGPVWFVCHRREIVRQASRAVTDAGLEFGVIAPGHEPQPAAPIQIASVYALRTRDHAYPPPGTIIWDEAHHMAAPSWAALMARYPGAKHVGLTATPERLDGKGLATWFDSIVLGPDIKSLIARGHLARYRIFAPTEPDLTAARIKHGDWDPADLDKIMNTSVVIGCAVEHYNRWVPDSRALVFATSIAASKAVVQKFAAQGTPAMHVDGETPDNERDAAVADLAAGRLKVLSNVGVFCEGVDVPGIDTVILLRPTRSLALYMQMIGRGLRPSEGKTVATIFDHGGCVYEHDFVDAEVEWSLEGDARKARLRKARETGEVIRRCPACYRAHEMAASCPECGYEYASRLEVGEFDGVLYELRDGPPEGFETRAEFAARYGRSLSGLHDWHKRGLPRNGDIVPVEEGVAWVRDNVRVGLKQGFETRAEFAKRHGVTRRTVARWISGGLNEGPPPDRYIESAAADEFVLALKPDLRRGRRKNNCPIGFVTCKKFARLHSISNATVESWVKAGRVTTIFGFLKLNDGLAVLAQSHSSLLGRKLYKASARNDTRASFSRRCGVSQPAVGAWIRRGLPSGPDKLIPIAAGLAWVQQNTKVHIPASAWDGVELEQRCAAD